MIGARVLVLNTGGQSWPPACPAAPQAGRHAGRGCD